MINQYIEEVNKLKKLIAALIIICFTVTFAGCNVSNAVNANIGEKNNEVCLNIITTNKLLYMAVKEIVKDKHYVRYMFRDGSSQWIFNYSQDSVDNIAKQDLFIYSGAEAEPWIDDFINKLSKGKVGIINASRGADILSRNENIDYNGESVTQNPYYYLNDANYKIILLNIKNAIEEKDSKNRKFYEENFSSTIKNIDNLDKRLKNLSSKMKKCTFIVNNDDYDYFAKYSSLKLVYLPQFNITEYDKYKSEMKDLEQQLSSLNDIYYLYNSDEQLRGVKELIDKYKITPVRINPGNFDCSVSSLLDYNISNLENIFSN